MKNKFLLPLSVAFMVVVLFGVLVFGTGYYHFEDFYMNPQDVFSVEILNGTTGMSSVLCDSRQIKEITDEISNLAIQMGSRDETVHWNGWQYLIIFKDEYGTEIKSITIHRNDICVGDYLFAQDVSPLVELIHQFEQQN